MNRAARGGRPLVAVVGGGFTGAAVAYHLAGRLPPEAVDIVVVEPRETLGAGLAYSTTEPAHRINVPAARMSLVSGDPGHFARWLEAAKLPDGDDAAVTGGGDVFPQRGLFGRYVADALAPLLRAGRIRHERDRAVAIAREAYGNGNGRFEIRLANGASLAADVAVLATTHPLPAVPRPLDAIRAAPGFVANPYDLAALGRIGRNARVLVVGNGLTAADTVATLDRLGHTGAIVALSRHGLRSRGHADAPAEPFGDFAAQPSTTALALLRRIRRAVAEATAAGLGWHPVIDAVRNQGGAIWRALPEAERRRLLRHLRSVWDVHRFRIAPQVEAVLDRRAAAGTFRSVAASLQAARPAGDAIEVAFRRRGARTAETMTFDVVVNTTGPAHRSLVEAPGPIRSLRDAGLLGPDPVGLGLHTAPDGRALDAGGDPVRGLYVAGPLARGTFGELMGLLEVTRYAEFIASEVAASLARSHAFRAHPAPAATASGAGGRGAGAASGG